MYMVAVLIPYIFVFILGITVGSFLNVCILRIPAGESIVTVPSHCPRCGGRLRWWELAPLVSYIALGGRCSRCKAPISPQYPLVEAANGALWCLLLWRFGPTLDFALTAPLCSALLVMSFIDARTREIPPGISLFILALAIVRLILDLSSWPLYLIGFFAVSAPLYLVLLLTGGRGVGGGDVKLMAVCGLFLGWKLVLFAFFAACAAGSVIHLALMALKRADRTLALGPYLALGVLIALLWGESIITWYISLLI